jgi:MinD-like ATPase involved in chromosome partitioning or flagellar assembly
MKLLFTFILLSSVCLGQSKKDQIIVLNNSIDGLYNVLKTFKDNSMKKLELFIKPVLLGTLIVTIEMPIILL